MDDGASALLVRLLAAVMLYVVAAVVLDLPALVTWHTAPDVPTPTEEARSLLGQLAERDARLDAPPPNAASFAALAARNGTTAAVVGEYVEVRTASGAACVHPGSNEATPGPCVLSASVLPPLAEHLPRSP